MNLDDKLMLMDNQRIRQYYRDRLCQLSLSQFIWDGLPDSCNRLYLERKLLCEGKACMMKPEGGDEWLSIGYVVQGNLDIYGNPTDIRGVGYNCANIIPGAGNWEILYDNMNKKPLLSDIDMYADLLAEAHATFRCNLQKQNTPYIVTGNKYQELSFKNIFLKIFGHSPYLMLKKREDLDSIKVLDLKVNFYGMELLSTIKCLWAEAISMLGISGMGNVDFKKERTNVDEVAMAREENIIARNARELNRKEFCEKMNKKHGLNLSVRMTSMLDVEAPYDLAQQEIASASGGNTDAEKGEEA